MPHHSTSLINFNDNLCAVDSWSYKIEKQIKLKSIRFDIYI